MPMSMRGTLDHPAAWDGRDFASKEHVTFRLGAEHLSENDRAPRAASAQPDPLSHEFSLQPGDICLSNNYTVLHAPNAGEDFQEPERRRHLLRLWLTSGCRSLGPGIAGGRQGVAAQAGKVASFVGAVGQGRIATR